ncbi:MAG TPA: Na+/H+ antiporter NhaA [Sphingomicrobium sp.]|nr:Na+/H+ antiporter NhaA [Sphingomicrobium sp.]
MRVAALDFASWAPAAGVSLLAMTIAAVALTNSAPSAKFIAFWERALGLSMGNATFAMPLIDWINHGLLSVFFLVVGLEVKREFTVGHLANRHAAALPVAAAIGGMVIPASVYALLIPAGGWAHAWGVPMATDTAFAVALIAMMGRRVPIELRIFLTAATIIDDIGAIMVVALFYSAKVDIAYLAAAAGCVVLLAFLNHSRVYRVAPYLLTGVALWAFIHAGGVHATLAGVLLALFIPTRPPPNLNSLMAQANAIIEVEARHGDEVLRHGPSLPALRTLDIIHERLESPADRTLRHVAPRSSFLVLPVFALANAGVILSPEIFTGHGPLVVAIICGLVVGKPVGMLFFCAAAVRLGIAVKPREYSWLQVGGAGALSGIGFTMSLFIAHQAFPLDADFAAAKIAVFAASAIAAVIGVALLWASSREGGEP